MNPGVSLFNLIIILSVVVASIFTYLRLKLPNRQRQSDIGQWYRGFTLGLLSITAIAFFVSMGNCCGGLKYALIMPLMVIGALSLYTFVLAPIVTKDFNQGVKLVVTFLPYVLYAVALLGFLWAVLMLLSGSCGAL